MILGYTARLSKLKMLGANLDFLVANRVFARHGVRGQWVGGGDCLVGSGGGVPRPVGEGRGSAWG